ncbi:MAG: peptide deformylase [Synechococcus sp.]
MAVLDIYEYPDPILRQPAEAVVDFGHEFQARIDDLIETLYASPGAIGLAATQVGLPLRVFLVDLHPQQPESDLRVYVNPIIVRSSRWKMAREGCLSFPEYLATVKRAKRLAVKGCDRLGNSFEHDLEGFEAVVVQHELDHLDGVLMIDRIRSISKDWRLRESPTTSE